MFLNAKNKRSLDIFFLQYSNIRSQCQQVRVDVMTNIKINDIFIKKLNYRSNAVNATHIYVQTINITTVINYIL